MLLKQHKAPHAAAAAAPPPTFGPFVHHIFVPLSTYLSPFLSARVRMLTASEPALGSLIDNAPIASPAQSAASMQEGYGIVWVTAGC